MTPPYQVLLVEDDEVDALFVQRAVKRTSSDIELTRAVNGQAALELLRKAVPAERPGLLLVDLNMPVMGGLEFLEHLRGDPQLSKLTAFVLTTSNHEREIARAYELGVAGYLLKSDVSPGYERLVDLLDTYATVVTPPPR